MLVREEKARFTFKKIHLAWGLIGIILFIASGMYMRVYYNGLKGMGDLPRMLFRSAHIYLLLTSLVNLSTGLYLSPNSRWPALQWIGSILILAAPGLMLIAFLEEPGMNTFHRTFAGPGVYAIFAGVLLHWIASFKQT